MAVDSGIPEEDDGNAKSPVVRRLILFVVLPTFLAAFYYLMLAADIFVSESRIVVNVEGSSGLGGELGALLPTGIGNAGNSHESAVVKEFIHSAPMIEQLKKDVGLLQVYDNPRADLFTRIPSNLEMENYLERYKDKVEVIINETTGIITLKVRGFTPQDSQKVGRAIVNRTEEFVNRMSDRMREDAIRMTRNEVAKSEKMVLEANQKIEAFREQNRNFDPNLKTEGIVGITSKLEEELASTNAEIANLRNYMQQGSPKITALQNKARALQQQIEVQTERITNSESSELVDINDEYAALIMQRDFALKRLEITLASHERAQAEALKKSRYLLRIVEPTLPQYPIEPRKAREIFTIFFALLVLYTLGGLIVAAIKDHVRP